MCLVTKWALADAGSDSTRRATAGLVRGSAIGTAQHSTCTSDLCHQAPTAPTTANEQLPLSAQHLPCMSGDVTDRPAALLQALCHRQC
jgi:hypothetical protein